MTVVYILLASLFFSGYLLGYIQAVKRATKHLKTQNDLLEKQNKIIADLKQNEDSANYWKPEGWKADWEPGDA